MSTNASSLIKVQEQKLMQQQQSQFLQPPRGVGQIGSPMIGSGMGMSSTPSMPPMMPPPMQPPMSIGAPPSGISGTSIGSGMSTSSSIGSGIDLGASQLQQQAEIGRHRGAGGHHRQHEMKNFENQGYFDRKLACTRQFPFQIFGPLGQLATNPSKSIARGVMTPYNTRYRPSESLPNSERVGNSEQAFIFRVSVTSAWNNFFGSVLCSSPSIRGNRYNGAAEGEEERGFFLIPPNTSTVFHKPITVLLASKQLRSEIVQVYGAYDAKNAHLGVTEIGANAKLILTGNPLESVLRRNENHPTNPFKLDSYYSQPAGGYIVPNTLYGPAKECWEKQVKPQLPFVDLLSLEVQFKPVGFSWAKAPMMLANVQDAGEIRDINVVVGVELLLTYRLV